MAKPRKESNEEQQFEAWLDEARDHGLVDAYLKQPESFDLISKATANGRHVHRAHIYTADFKVWLTPLGMKVLRGVFQKSDVLGFPLNHLYVDTKGGFMSRGTGQEFGINQKLVYERHGVWVAKVVPFHKVKQEPRGLFVDTWCPYAWSWCKGRKVATMTSKGKSCRTVHEFMASVKETV